LMDGVVKFLPSPNEKEPVKAINILTGKEVIRNPDKKDKLCALAFKVRGTLLLIYTKGC